MHTAKPRNFVETTMRIVAGLVAVFFVIMAPVIFFFVDGWWRKSCALMLVVWAFLFGWYAKKGRE